MQLEETLGIPLANPILLQVRQQMAQRGKWLAVALVLGTPSMPLASLGCRCSLPEGSASLLAPLHQAPSQTRGRHLESVTRRKAQMHKKGRMNKRGKRGGRKERQRKGRTSDPGWEPTRSYSLSLGVANPRERLHCENYTRDCDKGQEATRNTST